VNRALYLCITLLLSICLSQAAPITGAAVSTRSATHFAKSDLVWFDIKDLGVEGKGWTDTLTFYDRLPARAKGKVSNSVWSLSHHSAGICVNFITDATRIDARWTLRGKSLSAPHMPASGQSGTDLYALDGSTWRWLGSSGRAVLKYPTNQLTLASGIEPGKRLYRLYLPLYNGVREAYIGLPKMTQLWKAPPYPTKRKKPIIFFGTSITQGGCASRPGMAYPAILGRRLGYPTINLGFSGNGRMQPSVAEFISELDVCAFFVDTIPNMNAKMVTERTEEFVRIIRSQHPTTPIILAEGRRFTNDPLLPETRNRLSRDNTALKAEYNKLKKAGVKRLFYVKSRGQLGDDGDATVDGSHPTDLGMMRLADAYEPVLRRALRMSASR
jgi:GDSL-like Lipase/Acylhydrolase family/N-terminus of Esterase_SGNH_hydro-type